MNKDESKGPGRHEQAGNTPHSGLRDTGEDGKKEGMARLRGKVSLKDTFAALRHRNYRLWFWGQMISLMGSWMQTTAQGYLAFQLTHSPAYLGYIGFASGVPAWLFMLYGGVVADRISKRTVLLVTQVIMMVLALILAFLTFTGIIEAWHIMVLAFGLGIANAFDSPARQSFVLELIEGREDLVNAIALNSTMFNAASAVGPAVAGITYAAFGPAWCFTINSFTFLGVIAALLMMQLKKIEKPSEKKPLIADLKEGMVYVVKSQKTIRTLIILVTFIAVFGIAFATLVPAWAVKILKGDATTNGYMQSARGLGALLAALFIATVARLNIKGRLLTFGSFAYPLLFVIFSFVRWVPASLALLVAVGFAQILILNVANALIQTLVSDDFRGRVMGIYSISFFGFVPVGSLIIGTFAEYFGEPEALLINMIILLIATAIIFIKVPSLQKQG